MKRLLLYLASIIGVCLLVAIFDFFMHSNQAIEVIFIVLFWLLVIVFVGAIGFCIVLTTNKNTKVITKTVILCVVNFIGFCVLGFIYFIAFDLQWGITWQMVTFGLPLLAGMVFLVINTVFMMQKKSLKRGWWGFGIGWGALIITMVITNLLSYAIIPSPKNGPDQSADTEENYLIQMLISNKESCWHSYKDFKFFLVQPQFSDEFVADTSGVFDKEVSNITNHFIGKNGQGKYLDTYSYEDISSLVRNFLIVNQNTTYLTIKSSPKDGYYVDYDKRIKKQYYGIQNRIRWGLLYQSIGPEISISHPFYDEKTGLMMVYFDTDSFGEIMLFKYENDSLIELDGYITKRVFD
jgi:hypothetical protein